MCHKNKILLILFVIIFAVLTVPGRADADTLGQTQNFNVNSRFDRSGRTAVSATLRLVGEHAYYYVDDSYWNGLSAFGADTAKHNLQLLSDEFDKRIYPTETATWGSEPNPGIDGDPRVIVFLEDMANGNGGYFETINEYSKRDAPRSNMREMLTINAEALGTDFTRVFLAHELQHLISFNQKEFTRKVSEETWLNELRSEYSPALFDYYRPFADSALQRRVQTFLQNPADSLTDWPNTAADYAQVSLLGQYLVGRFGLSVLTDTLHGNYIGIVSLDEYLRAKTGENFAQVYADWMAANYLNNPAGGSQYAYANPDLSNFHVQSTYQADLQKNFQLNFTDQAHYWEPNWLEYRLSNPLDDNSAVKFVLSSQNNSTFALAMVIMYKDGTWQAQNGSINGDKTIYIANPQSTDHSSAQIIKIMLAVARTSSTAIAGNDTASLTVTADIVSRQESQEAISASQNIVIAGAREIRDGDLIKRNNSEAEMYVVEGRYKRFLRPNIIALYGQLDPNKVIPVDDNKFNSYISANYIRGSSDKKVYAVWPDGTKHWLNITPEQWNASGRDWGAIFVVNDAELAAYKTGAAIVR